MPSRVASSAPPCACRCAHWSTPCGRGGVLQTYDRDHFTWRGIARAKLDGRSRVRFSLPDALDRVRVVVVGTKGWADGVSRAVRLQEAT